MFEKNLLQWQSRITHRSYGFTWPVPSSGFPMISGGISWNPYRNFRKTKRTTIFRECSGLPWSPWSWSLHRKHCLLQHNPSFLVCRSLPPVACSEEKQLRLPESLVSPTPPLGKNWSDKPHLNFPLMTQGLEESFGSIAFGTSLRFGLTQSRREYHRSLVVS